MKLYYIYDALCGWCYGFSPVIKKFYEDVQDQLPLEVISGGMIVGEREGPTDKVAPYIMDAYKLVEDRTAVKFGLGFLQRLSEGSMQLSSFPPAKAMAAYKLIKDSGQLEFANLIQQAIFYEGKEAGDPETYVEIIKRLKINPQIFNHNYNSPATEEVMLQDFHLTQQLNLQGFPGVFIEEDYHFIMIADGYTPEEQLKENFEKGKEILLAEREK